MCVLVARGAYYLAGRDTADAGARLRVVLVGGRAKEGRVCARRGVFFLVVGAGLHGGR